MLQWGEEYKPVCLRVITHTLIWNVPLQVSALLWSCRFAWCTRRYHCFAFFDSTCRRRFDAWLLSCVLECLLFILFSNGHWSHYYPHPVCLLRNIMKSHLWLRICVQLLAKDTNLIGLCPKLFDMSTVGFVCDWRCLFVQHLGPDWNNNEITIARKLCKHSRSTWIDFGDPLALAAALKVSDNNLWLRFMQN